jgi:hypothetical protein
MSSFSSFSSSCSSSSLDEVAIHEKISVIADRLQIKFPNESYDQVFDKAVKQYEALKHLHSGGSSRTIGIQFTLMHIDQSIMHAIII